MSTGLPWVSKGPLPRMHFGVGASAGVGAAREVVVAVDDVPVLVVLLNVVALGSVMVRRVAMLVSEMRLKDVVLVALLVSLVDAKLVLLVPVVLVTDVLVALVLIVVLLTVTILISGCATDNESVSNSSPSDSKAACRARAVSLGSALISFVL